MLINSNGKIFKIMNNSIAPKHPVHALLDEFFEKSEISDVIAEFQCKNSSYSKWMMYSDYCLDDKTKANNVMTFVLMPFVDEAKYVEMQQKIHDMQPYDIKKSNTVNGDFLSYLKSESILIFSFVFDDRKHFLAPSYDQCLQCVKETLQAISRCYEAWKLTADNEEVIKYYDEGVKKINQQLESLSGKNPNIKLLNDILITAFLGAYVSAKVLEKLPIEIFGWFSDRDKVISGKDNIIVPIFNYYQHNMLGGRQFRFCTFTHDDRVEPFFDDFNRIADVVTGAIADYNMEKNYVTSEKFNTVFKDFLANKKQVLIFRIYKIDNNYHVGQIIMKSGILQCLKDFCKKVVLPLDCRYLSSRYKSNHFLP